MMAAIVRIINSNSVIVGSLYSNTDSNNDKVELISRKCNLHNDYNYISTDEDDGECISIDSTTINCRVNNNFILNANDDPNANIIEKHTNGNSKYMIIVKRYSLLFLL